MAIVAELHNESYGAEAVIPTAAWEWNALRDGDLKAGQIAVYMVVNHDAATPRYSRDTPVVVHASQALGRGLSQAAMRLVHDSTGAVAHSVYACLNEQQYWGYRDQLVASAQFNGMRPLYLPADPDKLI